MQHKLCMFCPILYVTVCQLSHALCYLPLCCCFVCHELGLPGQSYPCLWPATNLGLTAWQSRLIDASQDYGCGSWIQFDCSRLENFNHKVCAGMVSYWITTTLWTMKCLCRFQSNLDYIWYDRRRLKVAREIPLPTEMELAGFIPSERFPSDHLSVSFFTKVHDVALLTKASGFFLIDSTKKVSSWKEFNRHQSCRTDNLNWCF